MQVNLILNAKDVVGESIVWDDRRHRLIWVDIIGRRVHALDPRTRVHQLWGLEGRPTSIGLCTDGSAILGMEREICFWDWINDPVLAVEVEPDLPENRLNVGQVGPDGAFWVGTMQNNIDADDSSKDLTAKTGRLYRYTLKDGIEKVSSDVFGITNTLVFPDTDRLITADTPENSLFSYEIGRDGLIHNRHPFQIGFDRGLPDGSCLDAEGGIWTARVAGGACITRTMPDGSIDRIVELPCSSPTSCCFGGARLSTLFVTSARFAMSQEHLMDNPQEGAIFAVEAGVEGEKTGRFKM